MTEEELKKLRKIAKKEHKKAERESKKPLSKEEEYAKEFQKRCDAEAWGFELGIKKHIVK